jgi:putative transposase
MTNIRAIVFRVKRNYAYRLYPTQTQAGLLARVLDIHRQLYNAALQERRDAWQMCRVSLNYYDQANQLKGIRQFDADAAWLNYSSIQQTLRRLDKAFAAFFRRVKAGAEPGFPRFKSKPRFNSVEYRWGDGVRLKANRLHVQNIGTLKVKWHRDLPAEATIKCAYLKRDGRQWYVIFSLELLEPRPAVHPGPAVGLDVGLRSLVALSDGVVIENPRHFRATERRLADAQRVLSRRVKFSGRWRKQAGNLAQLHRHIANQRRDFAHKLARHLADTYCLIGVEDLNVLALSRSALAKSVHDAGWSRLLNFLAYKVEKTGSQLVAVDPRHTSQRCSGCGAIVPKDLSVRVHVCSECGLTLDRDVNAARNILTLAFQKGHGLPCPDPAQTEPSDCNLSVAHPRSRRVHATE